MPLRLHPFEHGNRTSIARIPGPGGAPPSGPIRMNGTRTCGPVPQLAPVKLSLGEFWSKTFL
jgi:hypothetical protein